MVKQFELNVFFGSADTNISVTITSKWVTAADTNISVTITSKWVTAADTNISVLQ